MQTNNLLTPQLLLILQTQLLTAKCDNGTNLDVDSATIGNINSQTDNIYW